MGIGLFWDDEAQTVILAEFKGRWDWDELHAAMHTIQRLSLESGQVYGAIIDLSDGMHIPGGALLSRDNLLQFQKLLQMSSKKGPVVVVGFSDVVKTIFDFVASVNPHMTSQVTFADTVQAARQKIYPLVYDLRST